MKLLEDISYFIAYCLDVLYLTQYQVGKGVSKFFHFFFRPGQEKPLACAKPNTYTVEVYVDRKKEHRWRLVAGNGAIICVSSEGYTTHRGALDSLKLVKKHIMGAPVQVQ